MLPVYTCMFFRADQLDNQLACSSLGKTWFQHSLVFCSSLSRLRLPELSPHTLTCLLMSFLFTSCLGSHVSEASRMSFYRWKKKTFLSSVFSWVFRLGGHGRRVRETWDPILILRRFQRQPVAGVIELRSAYFVPFSFPASFDWPLLTLPWKDV